MRLPRTPAVWFPMVHTGTGTDVFTERLIAGLKQRGVRAEIEWLPLRAEYAPWAVRVPSPPDWATVVHVNTWLRPHFLPRSLPIVATIHHSMHVPSLRRYKGIARTAYHRGWIAPGERRVLRRASCVVAVSRYVAETARETLCDVGMAVIHNGVDTQQFCPGPRMRQSGEPFRLLYVGGWKTLKGVDLLAPIMRMLGPQFELHYTSAGMASRERAAMPVNARDLGRLDGDAVVAEMQQADALLFPSRSEGFGQVVVEAMACGMPVIATRGSSMPELIDDGITGLLCPRDDVAAFAQAARRLASDVVLRTAMSLAARQDCMRRFDIGMMVEAYLAIYWSCL